MFLSSIRTIAATLRRLTAELGWFDAMLYTAARSLLVVSRGRLRLRRYYFFAQPVPTRALLSSRRGQTVHVRRIDAAHPMVARFPRPAEVIDHRFADGAHCFLATRDDAFVGFLWLKLISYEEDEVRSLYVPLPGEKVAWDFDVHVEEAHRISFAFARLWDTANLFLSSKRIEWSVSRISAFNPDSLRSHIRLGARPFASAVYLNGRRVQILLCDIPPYLDISLAASSRPVLRLNVARQRIYRRFTD